MRFAAAALQAMHILFVDDTFETRDLFRLCFNVAGHTVDTAHNGVEALRIMAQSPKHFDAVIMDYHMPQMNGLETVATLRKNEKGKSIPIILFTGGTKGIIDDEALELNVARVVYKPIVPSELIAIVQQAVASS